ncbi:bifunctional non-homologous end joining protein LigD [Microbacterium marinum]|uniref:DNA ligase (ATP) n=1 Tax=Microbacterium marinum TaxID=421115 RepID=A0A7W7FJ96_9MICO|nr:ATP-dependent DNA ligase [Microbacterium marinum]MBB4666923.1 bifunctional non-homologous end joining protein LigD [Microbacterium marinum]
MPAAPQDVVVDGRRLRLTNLDKVMYPETGTTKGEVIDYLTRVAPVMLPHLDGRPITRIRWPDGTGEGSFFAKHLEAGAPSWVARRPIEHSTGAKDYPLADGIPTLVYLAQVASIELHVPQWRFDEEGRRQRPDRLVLDLDPGPGIGLTECAEVARWAKAILEDLGMAPLPVTSGSKGIHLYAPLDGSRTSEEISAFAKELARALEADHPDLVVSQMSKALRPGKVFLDWSQNNGKKTTIAPYSLRGRDRPTVAAPRSWDELADPDLRHLLLDEVLSRVAERGDLFAALAPAGGGPLTSYIAKRSAERTPEPVPDSPAAARQGDASRFVIQEHHARRLHYDLRLERDGVLVSWAVPRGIPDSPSKNHLAVMTEPHPMEYLDFAGDIPAGEYGAGSMSIWDAGTFTLEKWRDDEVIFTATGRDDGPLGSARLALIRTSGSGEKSQWLLHRMKTDAAGPPARPRSPRGVDRTAPGPRDLAPMLASSSTPPLARRAAERWGPWVEFKWDGVRAIGIWDGARLQLRARSGTDITGRYPELTAIDAGLGTRPCVVDGEIVALDERNRPSFSLLQHRIHLTGRAEIEREARRIPVQFMLFDVLEIDGTDAAPLPLAQRRELLEAVAGSAIDAIVVPPVADDVDDALATAERLGLEGVVVKDPSSTYRRGQRSEHWLKVKLTLMQDVVIGGIRPGKGGRSGTIGSLLMGIPGPDGLRYVGRVGSGFSDATLARLTALLEPLRDDVNPFVDIGAVEASDALWVRPEVVGEVEYAEATPNGTLRHARWRGIRPDKAPAEVEAEA